MAKSKTNPKRKANRDSVSDQQGIGGMKLSPELHGWLVEMAAADERSHADFVRWMIRREWERRHPKTET